MKYQVYRSLFILGAGALMALLAFVGQSGFGEENLTSESQVTHVDRSDLASPSRVGVASAHNAL